MSEIYEGIACRFSKRGLEKTLSEVASSLKFRVVGLEDVAIAERLADRDEAFSELMEEAAATVSRHLKKAVLFRYDSRIGYRGSAVFENGSLRASYGEDDEEWVPLNAEGDPMLSAPRLKASQLEKGHDYATVMNAIDLGLRSVGGYRLGWDEVHECLEPDS